MMKMINTLKMVPTNLTPGATMPVAVARPHWQALQGLSEFQPFQGSQAF